MMERQRTRHQRAARRMEILAIAGICGLIGLVFLLGMSFGFAVVGAAW